MMQKPISRQELYESLVGLGLFPLPNGQSLKVLVVDDDPKAVELIALRMHGLAGTEIERRDIEPRLRGGKRCRRRRAGGGANLLGHAVNL